VAFEKSDIKLALVENRDHPPQEETFVTKNHVLTASVKETKELLEGCSAVGGGDLPEAVADGLDQALKLRSKGARTAKLTMNKSNMERASDCAIKYSKMTNLCELKESFVKTDDEAASSLGAPMDGMPCAMMCMPGSFKRSAVTPLFNKKDEVLGVSGEDLYESRIYVVQEIEKELMLFPSVLFSIVMILFGVFLFPYLR